MSIRLGTPEWGIVADFCNIEGDMLTVNSTITVTEGKAIKTEAGYVLCMIAKDISDLYKSEDFKADSKVTFLCHNKEYTRWTKDNPKLPVQPTPLEQTLTEWLDGDGSVWLERTFTGKLHLNGAQSVLDAVKSHKMWHILADFKETDGSLLGELKPKGKRGSGGNNGQKEGDKLTERLNFMITNAGSYAKDAKNLVELAAGLTVMQIEDESTFNIYMRLIDSTFQ